LIADRKTIRANTNDLAYVKVDIVDEKGNVAPDVNDLDVNYKLSGNATIAAVGNGSFDDASGFRQPHKKVYQGKGLVIVRPNGLKGLVTLTATADGLKKSSIEIIIK
jgi:beta-galactosidase